MCLSACSAYALLIQCTSLQVGGCSLNTGLRGAYYNVCINLEQVTDQSYVSRVREEVERMVQESGDQCKLLLETVTERQKK